MTVAELESSMFIWFLIMQKPRLQ